MVLNFTLVLSHYYSYCIIIMDDDKIALQEQQSLLCTDLHITASDRITVRLRRFWN